MGKGIIKNSLKTAESKAGRRFEAQKAIVNNFFAKTAFLGEKEPKNG